MCFGKGGDFLAATLEGSDYVSFSAMGTLELIARIHIDFFENHMELKRSHTASKSRSGSWLGRPGWMV